MTKLRFYFQGTFTFFLGAAGQHYVTNLLNRKEELDNIQNQTKRDDIAKESLE